MDPLSITASTIAIIQMSSSIVSYVNRAAGAPEQRKRLRDELRSCEFVVQRLSDQVSDAEESSTWLETIKVLEGLDSPLGRLRAAFLIVNTKLKPKKGLKYIASALKWPFEESDVNEIVSMIEREKNLLSLALANDSAKLIQEIKNTSKENNRYLAELIESVKRGLDENGGTFAELKDSLQYVQQGVDQLNKRQEDHERLAILDWLDPIDYTLQQSDFIHRRQAGTGEWLLRRPEYEEWLNTNGQTLFCPGIPGAGKTILTAIVVNHLAARFRHDHAVGIAYIYCDFKRRDEQKADALLANLVKQLCQERPDLQDYIKALYYNSMFQRIRPSFDEISKALQSVVALYSRVIIVVDALDECHESDGCRTRFLAEIFSLRDIFRANLFATSRFIPEITKKFEGKCSRIVEISASNYDVRNYLDSHMFRLPGFVNRSLELQEEIKSEVIRSVQGMYVIYTHLQDDETLIFY
jgi:hypothetical protein